MLCVLHHRDLSKNVGRFKCKNELFLSLEILKQQYLVYNEQWTLNSIIHWIKSK